MDRQPQYRNGISLPFVFGIAEGGGVFAGLEQQHIVDPLIAVGGGALLGALAAYSVFTLDDNRNREFSPTIPRAILSSAAFATTAAVAFVAARALPSMQDNYPADLFVGMLAGTLNAAGPLLRKRRAA